VAHVLGLPRASDNHQVKSPPRTAPPPQLPSPLAAWLDEERNVCFHGRLCRRRPASGAACAAACAAAAAAAPFFFRARTKNWPPGALRHCEIGAKPTIEFTCKSAHFVWV